MEITLTEQQADLLKDLLRGEILEDPSLYSNTSKMVALEILKKLE